MDSIGLGSGADVDGKASKNIRNSSTLSDEEALDYASDLKAYMAGFGTDSYKIWLTIKDLTKNDLRHVSEIFGKPRYISVGDVFGLGEPLSLKGWILEELEGDEDNYSEIIEKISSL